MQLCLLSKYDFPLVAKLFDCANAASPFHSFYHILEKVGRCCDICTYPKTCLYLLPSLLLRAGAFFLPTRNVSSSSGMHLCPCLVKCWLVCLCTKYSEPTPAQGHPSVYPSISLITYPIQSHGGFGPISDVIQWEAGYNLDRWLVHHRPCIRIYVNIQIWGKYSHFERKPENTKYFTRRRKKD